MPAEQESTRAIELKMAGVTDATRVGDLTVRQFIELLARKNEQPSVRRVPAGQGAVDGAIAGIRQLLGSLDEAFQRVQAAIPNEFPVQPGTPQPQRQQKEGGNAHHMGLVGQ